MTRWGPVLAAGALLGVASGTVSAKDASTAASNGLTRGVAVTLPVADQALLGRFLLKDCREAGEPDIDQEIRQAGGRIEAALLEAVATWPDAARLGDLAHLAGERHDRARQLLQDGGEALVQLASNQLHQLLVAFDERTGGTGGRFLVRKLLTQQLEGR